MSWALGERILTAQIPHNDPEQLAPAFELLTGVELPEPTIGDYTKWVGSGGGLMPAGHPG